MTERRFLSKLFENSEAIRPALDEIGHVYPSPRLRALVPLLYAVAEYVARNTRKCDREDCDVTFLKSAGRKQFFCSPRCAHIVALRNFRKRNGITSGHATRRKAAA